MPTPKAVTDKKKAEFIEKYPAYGSKSGTCRAIGITRQCVQLWTVKDEVFRAEYDRLKTERINELASFLFRIGTNEGIKVAQPNLTAAIFMLKNLAPKEFGERPYKGEKKSIKITREEIVKDYGKVSVTETKELTQEIASDNSD